MRHSRHIGVLWGTFLSEAFQDITWLGSTLKRTCSVVPPGLGIRTPANKLKVPFMESLKLSCGQSVLHVLVLIPPFI